MPRAKRALVGADPNSELPPRKSPRGEKADTTVPNGDDASKKANEKDAASGGSPCSRVGLTSLFKCGTLNANSPEGNSATEPKFVYICRPHWDIDSERFDRERNADDDEDDDKDDEDDEDDEDNEDRPVSKFVCAAAVKDRAEWPWVVSEEGLKQYQKLEMQAAGRDQDEHGLYIYNDYTAYGMNEVVDNWLNDYNKEISKKTVSPYAVWARLEGLSYFLQLDYVNYWFQGDDCRGFSETIALIGKAVLTGLQLLKTHPLLSTDEAENGGLRNISTVLALFIEFTRTWTGIGGDHDGETRWASNLARLAKANGIEIKGPYKFHKNNEGVLDCEEDSDYEDAPKVKRNKVKLSHGTWGTPYIAVVDSDDDDLKDNGDYTLKGWKALFKVYAKAHSRNGKLGGSKYDIGKMSKADKKRFGYGGTGGFYHW